MDPLSITANVVTVLQVCNTIVTVCYNYRATVKSVPWGFKKIHDEIKELRGILEALIAVVEALEATSSKSARPLASLALICDTETGTLASCLRELRSIETKLDSKFHGLSGARLGALLQALSWEFKDHKAASILTNLERYKTTLSLAISAAEATLLLEGRNMAHALCSEVEEMRVTVESLAQALLSKKFDERKASIIRWISPVDPWDIHQRAECTHLAGTGNWFLESPEFLKWRDGNNDCLWLNGFRKSAIMSFPILIRILLMQNSLNSWTREDHTFVRISNFFKVLDLIETSSTIVSSLDDWTQIAMEPVKIAYFYCDFRNNKSQAAVNIIGSLVAQLIVQSGKIPELLELEFDICENSWQQRAPNVKLLTQVLGSLALETKTIILIDALDECEQREPIFEFLQYLSFQKGLTNILVTSRSTYDIADALTDFTCIRLEERSHEIDKDIRRFVAEQLRTDRKLQWLKDHFKDEIAVSLQSQSAGMFRWAQCQLDVIGGLHTIKAIRECLTQLPRGLSETYENILRNVPCEDQESVRRILLWVAFSVLPLTLEEVHTAIAIEAGLDHLDEESLLRSPADVLLLCGSLVILSEEGYCSLAHLSVKDYLLSTDIQDSKFASQFAMDSQMAKRELTNNCLTSLLFEDLVQGPAPELQGFLERCERNPLLRHAAVAWPYYFLECAPTEALRNHVLSFFSSRSRGAFMSWVQILNADYPFKWNLYPRHATSLYYAATFGLTEIVSALVDSGVDLDAAGSRFGGTALHGAAYRLHSQVVEILLKAGANATKADFNRVTPLHTACTLNSTEIIESLLCHGARPDAVDEAGETPLDWARKSGQDEAQNLLLGLAFVSSAKVNSPGNISVWKASKATIPYFPNIYERRSGLEGSTIVQVEIGPTVIPLDYVRGSGEPIS